ncbi:MAG: hypothetical protein RIQ74_1995 [Pseudomonadota bacterium]|jgi:hypothetical protein
MERIATVNARPNVNGTGKTGFHANDDLSGQDATYLSPRWLNTFQEELCNIIEKNGVTLDPNSRQQLYDVIATNETVMALAEAMENRVHNLELITATKSALDQAVSYLLSNIAQHKNAANPHPQYLLATTFGVHLPMTANLNTPVDDAHRVFGWDGESGDRNVFEKSIRWWNWHDEEVTFKPWRAYGTFLLSLRCMPEGSGYLAIKIYSKDDVLLSDTQIWHEESTSFDQDVKHLFQLEKGGYAKIRLWGRPWNQSYAYYKGSIYVQDRAKSFLPVGYTSQVDAANFNENTSQSNDNDVSAFPAFEWFYFDADANQYLQLSSISTFEAPVAKVPHFHRKSLSLTSTDLWVIVEVGKQTLADNYTPVAQQVLRAGTDANGIAITQIPLSMRNVDTPNNETVVYKVAYFSTAQSQNLGTIPSGSLGGLNILYFRS